MKKGDMQVREDQGEMCIGSMGSGENDGRLTEDGRSGPRFEGKDGHMDVIPVPTPNLESRDGIGFLTLREGDVSRRGRVHASGGCGDGYIRNERTKNKK